MGTIRDCGLGFEKQVSIRLLGEYKKEANNAQWCKRLWRSGEAVGGTHGQIRWEDRLYGQDPGSSQPEHPGRVSGQRLPCRDPLAGRLLPGLSAGKRVCQDSRGLAETR